VPISGTGGGESDGPDAALAELERQGVVRRGSGRVPHALLKPGPRLRGVSMADTLAAERRSGW